MVAFIVAGMSFEDLESIGSGASLLVDAGHALTLCEMSALKSLCRSVVQGLSSYQADATPEVFVETLVSSLQGRGVRQQ